VQEGVYDEFVEKFAAKVRTAKVGNGFEDGVNQGPLIEEAALEKVQRHVDDAVAKGARVLVGGKRLSGQFFEPTVVADATADMLCAREETFGPFAPVFRFKTEQEAIDAANATEFGLASYFYSRDVGRIFRVSEALEYGMVGINVGILATSTCPSAASSSPAWAAKARTTAWTTTWSSSTSAWATYSSKLTASRV
jgi:succinate-semialdehyde dehydrogenase/glutarate-semialdehyde dehydrogenase